MNVSDKLSSVTSESKSGGLTLRSTVFGASLLLKVLLLHPPKIPKDPKSLHQWSASGCALPALHTHVLAQEAESFFRHLGCVAVSYGSEVLAVATKTFLYIFYDASLWAICSIQLCQHSLCDFQIEALDSTVAL